MVLHRPLEGPGGPGIIHHYLVKSKGYEEAIIMENNYRTNNKPPTVAKERQEYETLRWWRSLPIFDRVRIMEHEKLKLGVFEGERNKS